MLPSGVILQQHSEAGRTLDQRRHVLLTEGLSEQDHCIPIYKLALLRKDSEMEQDADIAVKLGDRGTAAKPQAIQLFVDGQILL